MFDCQLTQRNKFIIQKKLRTTYKLSKVSSTWPGDSFLRVYKDNQTRQHYFDNPLQKSAKHPTTIVRVNLGFDLDTKRDEKLKEIPAVAVFTPVTNPGLKSVNTVEGGIIFR